MNTKPLYTCLWFNHNAKEAAEYYCSIFPNSKIMDENPMVVLFEVNGTKFMGLNGGPKFTHSPAVSFVIECDTQQDIDYYWDKLGQNGHYDQCGWLSDKFGISWQIIPSILPQLMADPSKREKVVQAFMQMQKFEIEKLINA